MEPEPFEQTMRQFLRREPFQPFAVEMTDGRIIWITNPEVAIGGGGVSFITPDEWVEILCEEVRAIRPAVPGAAV